jgi:ankyrin repeat protein
VVEAEPDFEIELELPRKLPITLSEEEERQVSALVSKYQNTPDFNPERRVPPSGRSGLVQAAFVGDYITFVALIRMGAQINRPSRAQTLSVERTHDTHWTPLLMASYKGHLKMVDLLLKLGVNVNHQSDFGDTALTLAKELGGNRQIEALLLEDGADPYLHRKSREQIVHEHRPFILDSNLKKMDAQPAHAKTASIFPPLSNTEATSQVNSPGNSAGVFFSPQFNRPFSPSELFWNLEGWDQEDWNPVAPSKCVL